MVFSSITLYVLPPLTMTSSTDTGQDRFQPHLQEFLPPIIYRWDGAVSPNNTKCPNSDACCGPKATCLSNRLCGNPRDAPNL